MRYTPTIHGLSLSLGDEIEDVVPDCCDDEMTATGTDEDGYRKYRCDDCGTGLMVDPLGLVFDITSGK